MPTVTIPADKAEAFLNEALVTAQIAASSLEDTAKLLRDGKAQSEWLTEHLDEVARAHRLVERVRADELEFEVDEAVGVTLRGLLLDAGGAVKGACEGRGTEQVRGALAEVELWLTLQEQADRELVA